MPTYEYECTKCTHTFEEEAPISAPPRQRCPQCRGKVRRLVSGGTGILFKGSGFYATDSRRQAPAAAKSDGDSPSATASTGAETTPAANDSKPATADKP